SSYSSTARARVEAFIADHQDAITLEGVRQPGQGATNRVFFARRGDDLVVFKVFCERERKERECFALRHWGRTGLVPGLLWDAGPDMIVTTHVPGDWLWRVRDIEGEQAWSEASREAGRAVGALTRVPLTSRDSARFESRFYADHPTLESYFARILELGRAVHARDPDFCDGFWKTSLDFIEETIPSILAQPRVLYHQDVANFHVQRGRFSGFFDLEMCRVGCEAMQLGSALEMIAAGHAAWPPFREGWEAGAGKPLSPQGAAAAGAAGQLLGWREITRYLSYDGRPGSGFEWAGPADPRRYRTSFETGDRLLQTGVFLEGSRGREPASGNPAPE
ncbi:MAG: aminoglycoside phosphotransferase family protein, partial [Planctomycetes bacterium]|nr:aminoglycoside phosphotransferase family protein [Planctomycetota bacterium]